MRAIVTIVSKPAVGFEIMVISVPKIQHTCLQDYSRDVFFHHFPHLHQLSIEVCETSQLWAWQ